MLNIEKLKNRILKKIPISFKRNLEQALEIVSGHLPKSLTPPFPSAIIIDPVNICNLKCPLCPSGLNKLKYKLAMMSFNTFQIIIDKIPSLKHICLFNWGEPFLNPSIFKMMRYADEKNITVCIHTNFCFKKDDDFFLKLLESKLDTLIISLDGASQQSYSKYRIGGDFDLVLSNIKRLARLKHKLNYNNPKIIWKFIVNKFNEKEIENARRVARILGIEFEVAFLGLGDDLPSFGFKNTVDARKKYWLPTNKRYQHPYYRNEYKIPLNNFYCNELFKRVVINPDGKVFPCCWATDREHVFGDLTEESFEEIWYNAKYLYSRSLFSKKKYFGLEGNTVCSLCHNFKKSEKKMKR